MRAEADRQAAAFLAPAAAILCAVMVLPAAYVVWLSLKRHSLVEGAPQFVGLDNYRALFTDARFWNAFGNTVYFTSVSVAIEIVLGLAIALLLLGRLRGKAILYAVVLVPWATPTVVSARLWEWMYNADFGLLNYLLGIQANWLGSPGLAMHAAIAMDVWKSTPFVAILLVAGLQNIPRELYQAAAVDGASGWAVLRRITLPLLAPLIAVALIFRTIDAFRVFDAIYVLTGGGPANSTETLSIYAYTVLFRTLEFGYGSALSVAVFLCVGLLTLAYTRLLRRGLE